MEDETEEHRLAVCDVQVHQGRAFETKELSQGGRKVGQYRVNTPVGIGVLADWGLVLDGDDLQGEEVGIGVAR